MNPVPLLLGVALGAGAWLLVLRRFDRLEPEPLGALLVMLVSGGALSTGLAGPINHVFAGLLGGRVLEPGIPTVTGAVFLGLSALNEEFCKASTIRWLKPCLSSMNEPIDVVIYSLAVALGFAAFENLVYASRLGMGNLILRTALSIPGHMCFSAVWAVRFARRDGVVPSMTNPRWWAAIGLAAGGHALFNLLALQRHPGATLAAVGVILLLGGWTSRQLIRLERESPFRSAGYCGACGHLMVRQDRFCGGCGRAAAAGSIDRQPA